MALKINSKSKVHSIFDCEKTIENLERVFLSGEIGKRSVSLRSERSRVQALGTRHNVVVEAVELARVIKRSSGELAEVVGSIQTERLLKRHAYLVERVRHELRTDKVLLALPLYIHIHGKKSEYIVGVDVAVVNEMADNAVILRLLLLCDGNAVYLAGYVSELSERALADYLLVEGRGKRYGAVGTTEAVHLGKGYISRKRNVIERLFGYKSEKSRGTCTCLRDYHVDIILQIITSVEWF